LLIKYIKSILWRVAKRLSYIEDARCLKVNKLLGSSQHSTRNVNLLITQTLGSLICRK